MSLVQRFSLAPGYNPDRVQPAVNNENFAVPITRTAIGVWSFDKLEHRHKPLELQGHRRTITALAFGNNVDSKLLCSCAGDYVIIWDINICQRNFDDEKQVKGEIIGTSLGESNHCAFSADDSLVAVCVDLDVHILKSNNQSTVAILGGHLSRVTGAEFCPHYTSTVVTISDDQTFKIWDLENELLVYQSCVITAYSLVTVCMNWSQPTFSVGSADGIVRTFDLTDGNDFRMLHQIDISNISRKISSTSKIKEDLPTKGPKTISGHRTWKQSDSFNPQSDYQPYTDVGGESRCAVVGLAYAYPEVSERELPHFLRSVVTDVLNKRSEVLLVASTSSLLQIDPKTLETLQFIDLLDPISSVGNFASSNVILNALNYTAFTYGQNMTDVWAVVGTLLENRMHVLNWTLAVRDSSSVGDEEIQDLDMAMDILSLQPDLNPDRKTNSQTSELSLIATNPLSDNSLLHSKLVPVVKSKHSASPKKKSATPSTRKPVLLINQPLTFKNKIKSSGYTQAQPGKMFQPHVGKLKPTQVMKKSVTSNPVLLTADYPLACGHPNELVLNRTVCDTPTPVLSLRFCGTGQQIACGCANGLTMTYSMPLKKSGNVFQGHEAAVNSVYWSHDNNMLLTASEDHTAVVWMRNSAEPIMKISTVGSNKTIFAVNNLNKTNTTFPSEVKYAQFYYMDNFILLISGNTFYMYKYYINISKDEIKRYLTKSKYKLVKSWPTESKSLTSMAAVNTFYSHMAICASSKRNIEIFDMNEGRSASVIEDAHLRSIHAISINEGSAYVSQPSSAYNVFATAAIADCIRLWDIRSKRCVQRFEGHQNKAVPCGLAISPCGQYLASGSEDKLTYIFDIRTGTYCDRLRGHSDVVSSVAYHPVKPYLVSTSIGGNLVLFKPENWHK